MINYEIVFVVLGNFLELEATTDRVQDIFNCLKSYNVLPATIQIANFPGPGSVSYRPQFISNENNFIINFLPDRIEVVFSRENIGDNISLDKVSIIGKEVLASLNTYIHERCFRMANIVRMFIKNDNMKKDIHVENVIDDKIPYEWSIRTVTRDTIKIKEADEDINFVFNANFLIQEITVQVKNKFESFNGLLVELDMNTSFEKLTSRFDSSSFSEFVDSVNPILKMSFVKIKDYYEK